MVGIDGRSGSGKSTVARDLAAELDGNGFGTCTVQLDWLCPGWHGLDRAVDLAVRWVLEPLAGSERGAGRQAGYRRWDWHRSRYAEWVSVTPVSAAAPEQPASVLIVEGCGIGSARARELLDVLVWIDVPEPVRWQRAAAREHEFLVAGDAEETEPAAARREMWWWPVWAAQEDAILARERIKRYADVVLCNA
ncbi:uridine kinase family protein [Spelaeicoccus albus]|uniref:Uridine kinase n=1 Tax=Spelaeicoccus albus TaxID=1280376 RepID=A0A7Z0D2S2_9MICO|nr:hypothetical protein [Spelaeicoccus albus]NYI67813.1 uridine kinase [Spelaeicoccus albus]